ncbi:membrane metallo-endopeptidase-like 1 [Leptopilina heterotoma]|uniref:membrane metallo-endopeptidase-like 1 n=1 Tax=Leptopilina heterotoma TaxID=63436 RepID=UPI001CA8A7B7|nr:membrane metallo-endopeptidase-like 1 [Leptopilina heterotoma]XP_043477200.1 membrane metallo-endopeptidase-like 1 [Leptopilina heterotoma]XP_043477201.1 membrane metallo-endopeptidase-like 1 [Leptopilina heterotoma]XP_043477202.1 membrane metallo-endopeptidase-like 1 [Leptopilina heterotoma]
MIRLGIVLYIFVIATAEQVENKAGENDLSSDVCHSTECFQIAHDIWQSMNHSVNPCDNFYEYACGNFGSSNPVPKSEMAWGTVQKMRRKVRLRMLEMVTEKYNSSDILPMKQVKKFYRSCTNYFQIAQRGLKHIKTYLAQIGGWPLIMEQEEWSSNKISWQDINKFYSRMIFLPSFYRVRVTRHFKNLSDFTLDVDNPFKVITILPPTVPLKSMALYSGKFFNKNITNMYDDGSYANYTVTMADILARSRSANISREQLLQDVENMIELEKKFQNISDTFDSEPNYVKIDELQEIYDKNAKTPESRMNWKELMTEFFDEAKVELNGDELFQVASDDHFEKLSEILENTDRRTLANYMHWHFVSYLLPYTSLYFQAFRINLFNHKEGIMEKPRWESCIRNLAMPRALAYQYVKKFFSKEDKDKVELIFIAIQKEMVKRIKEANWLSDETKKDELEKIENMKINIGFPEWLNNETSLTEMYQGLVIGNQYMENIISIKRFNAKKDLKYLKSTAKIKDWYAHPIFVNAYFFHHKNILNIPAAAIQPPVFSILQPNTVNYGEIGFIIGHEVSHGFDATGIEFNKDGRKYIWPEDTRQAIKEKTECFANQYEKFKNNSENKIVKKKVGSRILNENLSDSLGISLIFSALEEIEKTNKSLKLPGFENWSNKKIFFLSYARLHCFNATPGYEKMMGKYFNHSPHKYRVNGPLQNFEPFAKVFNCPVDSPMNPSSKCKLW